ncbi:Hypothetical protein ACI5QN_05012 [Bacillus cereus]|uniref:LCP family glycopolymer transferase n=1 Tax=Bacillus cereus TaxID=1396 RepID=UPI003D3558A9
MKKKILLWILGIIGVMIIGGGVYAYNVYSKVSKTLDEVHKPLKRDKGGERGEDKGRSDSLMVITLNPKNNSMKTVSIPRDTYTEIVGKGKSDKINHAYAFGGVDMSVATVEKILNIPINYYIEVNMEGFKDIVDAVGGVDVNNDLEFTDPRGDFGRQMRQRQVMQAVIKKGASFSSLSSYGDVLTAIQKNVKTNLTQDQMFDMQKNYKDCLQNSEDIQIPGDGHKAADGIWYYYVPDAAKQDLTNKLRAHLEVTK